MKYKISECLRWTKSWLILTYSDTWKILVDRNSLSGNDISWKVLKDTNYGISFFQITSDAGAAASMCNFDQGQNLANHLGSLKAGDGN